MTDYIIGIDCATDPKKRGIAVAMYAGNSCIIESAGIGMGDDELIELITPYSRPNNRILLALDAPLGWPSKMGTTLKQHRVGQCLPVEPNIFSGAHHEEPLGIIHPHTRMPVVILRPGFCKPLSQVFAVLYAVTGWNTGRRATLPGIGESL